MAMTVKEQRDDCYAVVFDELRAMLAARIFAANRINEAIDLELQITSMTKKLPPLFEPPLTVAEANELTIQLTGGAMSIVESNGNMELRGATAGSGVRLFRILTTRAGIAAALMEYYR